MKALVRLRLIKTFRECIYWDIADVASFYISTKSTIPSLYVPHYNIETIFFQSLLHAFQFISNWKVYVEID